MLCLSRHHNDALYALLDQALPADKLKTDLTVNVQLAQLPVGNAQQFHSNLKVRPHLTMRVLCPRQEKNILQGLPIHQYELHHTHSTKQQPAPFCWTLGSVLWQPQPSCLLPSP